MIPATSPIDATFTQALAILRLRWAAHVNDIFRGRASLWLGSGISRSRFDSVPLLLRNLFITLHSRCNGDEHCPYKNALRQILRRTTITPDELNGIDWTSDPTTWPRFEEYVKQLQNQYSTVLGIPVVIPGNAPLSLPWDVLRLQEVYSNPAVLPDAEHSALALLIEEASLLNLVTTNWDPLIERAHARCRGNKVHTLEVVACVDELAIQRIGNSPRLLKIHGCASRTTLDEPRYRPFMVATDADIANWIGSRERAPITEALRTLLRAGPSIFIGLSGQDGNLQALFAPIREGLSQPYPPSPVRVVFATSELSADQLTILNTLYGSQAVRDNFDTLEREAALPLYAKPLLGGLYFLAIKQKIQVLLELGQGELLPFQFQMATEQIQSAEEIAALRFDAIEGADERWSTAITELSGFISRLMSLYRYQALGTSADEYEPLSRLGIGILEGIQPEAAGQLHWLILTLASLVLGHSRGVWRLHVPLGQQASQGQLLIEMPGQTFSMFFVDRASYRSRLGKNVLDLNPSPNPVMILYPVDEIPLESARTPARRMPGASSSEEPIELSLRDVLNGVTTSEELLEALRLELIAARRSW